MVDVLKPDVFLVTFDSLRSNTDFVVKDMCIFNVTTNRIQTFSFRPPFPEYLLSPKVKRTNAYVSRAIHGIWWNDGYIDYGLLPELLGKYIKRTDIVYVKGLENLRFLQYVMPSLTCKNMESDMKFLSSLLLLDSSNNQSLYYYTLGDKYGKGCMARAQRWSGILRKIFQFQKGVQVTSV
jgi:hypothetical protein